MSYIVRRRLAVRLLSLNNIGEIFGNFGLRYFWSDNKNNLGAMPEVTVAEVRRFMEDCMLAVGTPQAAAKAHVDLLLHADIVGHYSHGLNRLGFYINDIEAGSTQVNATPVILKQSAASAWVDGCDALGATVAHFCVDLAMKKAREAGIAIVTAQRSNHYGMAGYWGIKAEKEGLIGMAFTNTSPILVPTRAKYSALGTNPLAMAAPAQNGDSLVVDMAATAVALGKIEVQIHKGEDIPLGWAMDSEGKITTDAQKAFTAGRLLPLGGVEETSGYKGYALSAMVEVLCSGLSASKPTHKIRTWDLNPKDPNEAADPPNLGQCFIVIDPSHFAPGFAERMADCLSHWRGMEPMDPSLPVLAPGDKERLNAQKTADRGTIRYSQGQIDTSLALAKRIGAKPIQTL